jgi:hypothetical protein
MLGDINMPKRKIQTDTPFDAEKSSALREGELVSEVRLDGPKQADTSASQKPLEVKKPLQLKAINQELYRLHSIFNKFEAPRIGGQLPTIGGPFRERHDYGNELNVALEKLSTHPKPFIKAALNDDKPAPSVTPQFNSIAAANTRQEAFIETLDTESRKKQKCSTP